MRSAISIFFLLLALPILGCSSIGERLKASPIENSPFARRALAAGADRVVAAPENLYPFHRVWRSNLDTRNNAEPIVYVAPVDVSQIVIAKRGRGALVSPSDISALAGSLRAEMEQASRDRSFRVVQEPPIAGRLIELALVELSPTDVPRNVIGTAFGAIFPGAGLIAAKSSASIAIEGAVRDATSGEMLLVFADRERGKTAPFSLNDFTLYSHARAAIDDWADQLAEACTTPEGTVIADSSAVTLLPL